MPPAPSEPSSWSRPRSSTSRRWRCCPSSSAPVCRPAPASSGSLPGRSWSWRWPCWSTRCCRHAGHRRGPGGGTDHQVGGGRELPLAFRKQNPKLRATILDFPETVSTSTRYATEAGLSDRVGHVAGNAITTEWPADQDVVLMSYLWSAVGGNDIKVL